MNFERMGHVRRVEAAEEHNLIGIAERAILRGWSRPRDFPNKAGRSGRDQYGMLLNEAAGGRLIDVHRTRNRH
jgi:hypothetical protein